MSNETQDYARLPFARRGGLTDVMAACSAYYERRAWFAAQPKSEIEKGVWRERKEAPEMIRLAEGLVRALLSDSGLCVIRTRETDLGLAPCSSLLNVMWGDISIAIVFFGGRLTAARLDEIESRIPSKATVIVLMSIEPPDFATADRLTTMRADGRPIVLSTPTDVDALASGKWSVISMVCYKLLSSLLLGENDHQTIYDSTSFTDFLRRATVPQYAVVPLLDSAVDAQEVPPTEWLAHPIAPELVTSISSSDVTFLLGTSASGKSTLALSAGLTRQDAGETVYVIDAGAVSDDEVLAACSHILTAVQSKSSVLLILDDMQSNPRIAANILAWVQGMQRSGLTQKLRFLGVSWPEFLATGFKAPFDAHIHIIAASQIAPAMVDASRDGLRENDIEFAITTSGSDLLVLRLVLYALGEEQKDLSRPALAQMYWSERTRTLSIGQDVAKRAMLVAATLGRYECEITRDFLRAQADVSDSDTVALCRCKLLRSSGTRLHAGHRSLCDLLAQWLESQVPEPDWVTSDDMDASEQLVLNYIRSLKPHEIWPILDLIQGHAGFRASHELRESGRIMIDAWQSMDGIIARIGQQQKTDSSWGTIPSSAMFAVQALCAVGKREAAESSMEFIRSAYSLTGDKLTISTEDLGTNNDFVQIRERMIEEDALTDLYTGSAVFEAGVDIDPQLFHETWFSGLTLCAEAFWGRDGDELPERLALSVEHRAAPEGCFYPARVPWCTARVLMGLALCGRTVINSHTVKAAADWLLTARSEGGVYNDGLWDSGTGTWNTPVETTAMCLVALLLAKVNPAHPRVQKGLSELMARRSEWARAGREIDGAMALLAFSMLRTDWRSVLPQLQHLATWAKGEAIWRAATMSSKETLDQSCKVAEVGAILVEVLWRMLRADLPQLLHAFAISTEYREVSPLGGSEIRCAASTPVGVSGDADILAVVSNVPEHLRLRDFSVVGNYTRYSNVERHLLRDVCSRMELACRAKTSARQNFVLWGRPGTGKTYLVSEFADSMRPEVGFHEINVAKCDRSTFETQIAAVEEAKTSCIGFIDEVDAHHEAAWPFEVLMPRLDVNTKGSRGIVWVLAGSSSESLEEFIASQRTRTKGTDVFDRIPGSNVISVPPPSHGDRLLVAVSQALTITHEMGKVLTAIERFALYYLLSQDRYGTPRQIREAIVRACERVPLGQKSMNYDHFFDPGDNENKLFWSGRSDAVGRLAGQYIEIEP